MLGEEEQVEEYFLVGKPPELREKILEELVAQDFRFKDEVLHSPLQVFLVIEGQWYRTSVDGPQLYWRLWERAPEPWEVPEEGLYSPLRDLGQELGLRGQVLEGHSYGIRNNLPSVSLTFRDGRQITFFGEGDAWSAFELVMWFRSS